MKGVGYMESFLLALLLQLIGHSRPLWHNLASFRLHHLFFLPPESFLTVSQTCPGWTSATLKGSSRMQNVLFFKKSYLVREGPKVQVSLSESTNLDLSALWPLILKSWTNGDPWASKSGGVPGPLTQNIASAPFSISSFMVSLLNVCSCAQLLDRVWLFDHMDYSLLGPSVHGFPRQTLE